MHIQYSFSDFSYCLFSHVCTVRVVCLIKEQKVYIVRGAIFILKHLKKKKNPENLWYNLLNYCSDDRNLFLILNTDLFITFLFCILLFTTLIFYFLYRIFGC